MKNSMYHGNAHIATFDSKPNSGGINVEPIYTLAICMPTIACEFSRPKCTGVECTTAGYIGAQARQRLAVSC